jgi:ankyrin repeat protein
MHATVVGSLTILGLVLAGCGMKPDAPLTRAAAAGRVEELRRLAAAGADVNATDRSGTTPLVFAARSGQVEAVRALLELGAGPDLPSGVNDWPPLLHAIHKNHNAAAVVLLDYAGERGLDDALLMASGYGNAEMVRILLDRGADPRARSGDGDVTVLSNAVGGAWDIDYSFPGCEAHTATVKAILEKAPDLRLPDNFTGRAALRFARNKGCDELVALVEQGVLATAGGNVQ